MNVAQNNRHESHLKIVVCFRPCHNSVKWDQNRFDSWAHKIKFLLITYEFTQYKITQLCSIVPSSQKTEKHSKTDDNYQPGSQSPLVLICSSKNGSFKFSFRRYMQTCPCLSHS